MAVLWSKQITGTRYEVRRAGGSRRLYTDGVFHSQFNPHRPVTGNVWDLLMLPAFFYPPGTIRRVLVLGVGGGAVIRQLLHFIGPAQVVGVELDPVHLYLARRFFGVRRKGVVLHQGDAVEWVRGYRGPPFDMVIDDLFGQEAGEPVRAVPASARWFNTLLGHLSPEGVLVANFASNEALGGCAYFSNRGVARRFKSAFRFTTPQSANAIGAFLRRAATGRMLRTRLAAVPGLDPARKTCGLRYRLRRLPGPAENAAPGPREPSRKHGVYG